MTPQRTLLNHSPPSRASRGSSANSARGFSSSVSTNSDGWGSDCAPGPRGGGAEGVGKETEGAMFRKILNATCGAALVQLIPPVSAQPERRAFLFDTMGGGGRKKVGDTLEMTSAVSANVWHRWKPVRARKSSINRVPMLYPLCHAAPVSSRCCAPRRDDTHLIQLLVDLPIVLVILSGLSAGPQ